MGDEVAEARCPEPKEPACDAEVPMTSEQQRSRGQADGSKPGEHTDARDAEAEHVVGDRKQVSSPGGRRGGQVGDRQGLQQERQVMDTGKSCMDAVEQSGKGERVGEAYMQG